MASTTVPKQYLGRIICRDCQKRPLPDGAPRCRTCQVALDENRAARPHLSRYRVDCLCDSCKRVRVLYPSLAHS